MDLETRNSDEKRAAEHAAGLFFEYLRAFISKERSFALRSASEATETGDRFEELIRLGEIRAKMLWQHLPDRVRGYDPVAACLDGLSHVFAFGETQRDLLITRFAVRTRMLKERLRLAISAR